MNKQEIEKSIENLIKIRKLDSKTKQGLYDTAISALTQQLTAEPTASEFLRKAKAIRETDDFKIVEETSFAILDYIMGMGNALTEVDLVRKVMDYQIKEDTDADQI